MSFIRIMGISTLVKMFARMNPTAKPVQFPEPPTLPVFLPSNSEDGEDEENKEDDDSEEVDHDD